MSMTRRFLNLFRRRRVMRDIEREMRFHLEERADELVIAGWSETDAMREARRRFGNQVYRTEQTREVDLMTSIDTLFADIRYGIRTLAGSRLFAAVAVLSLALGIGANTAIFSLINAVMLKSLPVSHPEQLVQVTLADKEDDSGVFTNPLWEALRDRQDVFSGIFAYGDNTFNLAEGGVARNVPGSLVSGDFFRTLGVRPEAGRLLGRSDDFRGCPGAAVLGYGLWKREYGGEQSAIGKTISLQGHHFPIVGVADRAFFGLYVGTTVDVYLPLCAEAVLNGDDSYLDRRSTWWLRVVGRPKPDVSLTAVKARLATLAPAIYQATVPPRWGADMQADYLKRTLSARSSPTGLSEVREEYSSALIALMVIVAVVLVIACANVANLLLARATSRQREIAVRLALGAGRGRLIRQLLTESLLLSGLGAALGVVFARWGSRLLVSLLSDHNQAVWLDLTIDRRVLFFTIGIAVATGMLFGLAPAWRSSRVEPQGVLKTSGRTVVEGHSRFSIAKVLVVAQIALSLVLVMGAALLLGSFRSLATMAPGFDPHNMLIASLDMNQAKAGPDQNRTLYETVLQRAQSIPGVEAAAISFVTPMGGSSWNDEIIAEGYTPKSQEEALSWVNQVSQDYMRTYGMHLIAGRTFDSSDRPGTPKVAVVNEAFAKRYFGTVNAVGRHYSTAMGGKPTPPIEVIGVVNNSKYNDLKSPMEPITYISMDQDTSIGRYYRMSLRTNGDIAGVTEGVKRMAAEIDPATSLEFVKLDTQIAESIQRERVLATLSGFFGGLALLLAMIGLFGIMSYSVARRRGEIGVRMALGSARIAVVRMVLGEVSGLVVGGLLLGSLGVFTGMKLLQSLLFDVSPTDPVIFIASAATLAAVAIVSGAVPAWRAGRVDPMEALREE